jgi:hypothetical protein
MSTRIEPRRREILVVTGASTGTGEPVKVGDHEGVPVRTAAIAAGA